jgi:rhodanese-related sulfurtransferase
MRTPTLSLSDLKKYLGMPGVLLVDVREKWEYEEMHIQGAVHIPLKELPHHLKELEKYDTIITLCAHGVRSKKASEYLESLPCNVTYVLGDIEQWKETGLPIIKRGSHQSS